MRAERGPRPDGDRTRTAASSARLTSAVAMRTPDWAYSSPQISSASQTRSPRFAEITESGAYRRSGIAFVTYVANTSGE